MSSIQAPASTFGKHAGLLEFVVKAVGNVGGRTGGRGKRGLMGGSTYVSSLIHRLLHDAKERRTLAAHERALNAESEKVEK